MSRALKTLLAALWLMASFYLLSPTVYTYFDTAWSGYLHAPPGARDSAIAHLTQEAVRWYSVK
jgi:hypothetical protein